MLWVLAIGWITYWSFRLSQGRDLGGTRRTWTVRTMAWVVAFVAVVVHWFVVGAVVDALWPGLGYEGVAAIVAEAAVIASGALVWGYLVPKAVCAKLVVRSPSALDVTPDG